MRAMTLIVAALVCCAAGAPGVPAAAEAEELRGAAEAMRSVRDAGAAADEAPAAAADEDRQTLRRQFEALAKEAPTLDPAEASRRWIELVDRLSEAMRQGGVVDPDFEEEPEALSLRLAVEHLPPPAAWDELAEALEERDPGDGRGAVREASLHLLAHRLVQDAEAQAKDLETIKENLPRRREPYSPTSQALEKLQPQVEQAQAEGDGAGAGGSAVAAFERRLDELEKGGRDASRHEMYGQIEVPDLVTLAGEEKAEELLRRALVQRLPIQVELGERTQELARQLALEMVDQLKVPQWQLAQSLDGGRLYEALDKRFGPRSDRNEKRGGGGGGFLGGLIGVVAGDGFEDHDPYSHERTEARGYYLLSLIIEGRTDDATQLLEQMARPEGGPEVTVIDEHGFEHDRAMSLPYGAMHELVEAGHAHAVYDFIAALLEKDPKLPLWEQYIELASRVGETDKALERVRQASEEPGLSGPQRQQLRAHLRSALLAADRVDEAVELMREALAAPEANLPATQRAAVAMKLAKLGMLLERPDWLEEGVRAARDLYAKAKDTQRDWQWRSMPGELAQLLVETGRTAEAEAMLIEQLANAVRESQAQEMHWGGTPPAQDALIKLAGFYHQVGRHADVLLLLDEAAWWGVRDVKEIAGQTDPWGTPVSFVAAAALADAGRKDEAMRVLQSVLDQNPGFDPGYALLVELATPQEALAILDRHFARDQFEERPLIWKAELLRRQGRLDEAEETAKRAIAIDPSDGEQGRGRRMRVYAVMSEIRRAEGDAEEADFFAEVVKAIRLSEDADRVYAAGLLRRGIEMYREALTHFADAYCIQSRLAIQLAEMGDLEQAAVHYRKAYELMPDSFGRMESHCFGCEGAFRGTMAQAIAEDVFTTLAQEQPDKPQVHYLLGYLRQSQGRHAEALESFRKAVELDPDYLNAWKNIQGLGERMHLSAELRDEAALNVLRLDPLGRHSYPALGKMTDLAKLWEAVATVERVRREVPETIYPLAESQARLERLEAARREAGAADPFMRQMRRIHHYHDGFGYGRGTPASPGEALAQHEFLAAVIGIFDEHTAG